MAQQLTVPAPAKLNLFLHVVGRRASDGYHLLESAMVFVNFGDTLTLTKRDDGRIIRSSDVAGVPTENDLCLRAARALQSHTGCKLGVEITLDKRIPMGAGLGGGSSDAASVLLALNRLWRLHLSRTALMQIGLSLGADIPFFIFGRAALARGVGEALTAISVPTAQLLLAKPDDHAPTPLVFSQPDLVRNTATLPVDALFMTGGRNDLQPVAERLFPSIRALRESCGPNARMSGSGAAIFALDLRAESTQTTIAPWLRIAKIMTRHPLHSFAHDN